MVFQVKAGRMGVLQLPHMAAAFLLWASNFLVFWHYIKESFCHQKLSLVCPPPLSARRAAPNEVLGKRAERHAHAGRK